MLTVSQVVSILTKDTFDANISLVGNILMKDIFDVKYTTSR